jgi:hypothetical protein
VWHASAVCCDAAENSVIDPPGRCSRIAVIMLVWTDRNRSASWEAGVVAAYSFVTRWSFDAPIEAVWEAIRDYQAWPSWWPSIAEARRIEGTGVGETVEFAFRTRLPYRLRFRMTTTRLDAPRAMDGRASGELAGTGRWRLADNGHGTDVTYYWDVRTTRWWMNMLAPVARPMFKWNHDQVMADGRRGLARLLARRTAAARAPGAQAV